MTFWKAFWLTFKISLSISVLLWTIILAGCGDSAVVARAKHVGINGCEVGERFPCGDWLHFAGHHCPSHHVLVADGFVGAERGQICVAYVDAIPDFIGSTIKPSYTTIPDEK